MGSHPFHFDGGRELSTMGATWFVSYLYYQKIDNTHRNWDSVKTCPNRISVFNRTQHYYRYWLERVLEMNDKRLNTTTIGLKAKETKEMAKKLLQAVQWD
ncbi:MAG: hypothetical protein LBT00_02960 [Spirochaetaceae bacterium]|jgi:hypothetical protein|nr:hypothetical protein [Spirochaetaceae bacterium]